MHATVAICTWNRSQLLRQTLDQFLDLAIPAGMTWELLVVNNNSTDDTDVVLAEFESRLPLRRLFEREPGLSHARNAALAGGPRVEARDWVLPSRMTLAYGWRRGQGTGRLRVLTSHSSDDAPSSGVPRWLLRRYLEVGVLRWLAPLLPIGHSPHRLVGP